MVSTTEEFIHKIQLSPDQYELSKNQSARKSTRHFFVHWEFIKNAVCRLAVAKSKRKAIKSGNLLWSVILKRRVHTKDK